MSPNTPRSPRRGHLREVQDGLPTVPELLETDALLDRLGRHETTDRDLHDTVARILDAYALNSDPETAGVRPLELPALEEVLADHEVPVEAPVRVPRVLTARRRTLERIGRGGVAAAAVLALMGGTAAAAATGGASSSSTTDGGTVAASSSARLPDWVPTAVIEVFGGTPEQKAHREIAQAKKMAESGDPEAIASAEAQIDRAVEVLKDVDASPQVISSALAEIAKLRPDAVSVAVVPGTSPTSLGSVAGANRAVATPSSSTPWRAPLVTPPATTTPPAVPSAPTGTATTAPTTTPTRPTSPPASSGTGTGSGGSTTAPTGPVPTTPVPGSPDTSTDPGTPTTPVPTTPDTSAPVTSDPVVPPGTGTGGTGTGTTETPGSGTTATEAPVVAPVATVTTTTPVPGTEPVVVPSPEAGLAPSPTDSTPLVTETDGVTAPGATATDSGTGPAVPTGADASLTS